MKLKLQIALEVTLLVIAIGLLSLKGLGVISWSWWIILSPVFLFMLIPGAEYRNEV